MAESHGGAGTTAHTEADGGEHDGGFPPFDSSTFPSQLVSLVIAFVALYVIVSRVALPRVGGVIDARQNAIDGDLAAAQKLKDESEAALRAYESDLASARTKAQAIVTANPGCILQLRAGAAIRHTGQEVLHVVELLDRAIT